MESNPPRQPGICDVCGTTLIQRSDDRPETVAERLRLYRQDTLGMIPYYRDQRILHVISGQGGIEEIYSRILEALNKVTRRC